MSSPVLTYNATVAAAHSFARNNSKWCVPTHVPRPPRPARSRGRGAASGRVRSRLQSDARGESVRTCRQWTQRGDQRFGRPRWLVSWTSGRRPVNRNPLVWGCLIQGDRTKGTYIFRGPSNRLCLVVGEGNVDRVRHGRVSSMQSQKCLPPADLAPTPLSKHPFLFRPSVRGHCVSPDATFAAKILVRHLRGGWYVADALCPLGI
ncbi:hypothetical protein IWX90DRAFT_256345 [Phyllosticta citrichinensis]|uniref:Uncharacterized protein n=1 Tax=Phyllosticta citrichinensis TaxID=1130410 RepID=A0ABR1XRM3_9PEZI